MIEPNRELWEIWEEPKPPEGSKKKWIPELPWRAQMIDYVAQFPNKAAAERYIATVKANMAKWRIYEQTK